MVGAGPNAFVICFMKASPKQKHDGASRQKRVICIVIFVEEAILADPSPLDLLMSRIEEINHKTPPLPAQDIDTIIAYHRHMRARKAAGEKLPARTKADTAKVIQSLDALMASSPKTLSKPMFKLKASS